MYYQGLFRHTGRPNDSGDMQGGRSLATVILSVIRPAWRLLSCNKPAPPAGVPAPAGDDRQAGPEGDQSSGIITLDGLRRSKASISLRESVDTLTISPSKRATLLTREILLFVIDPRPYQATLDQAKAQQREAEANQQLQDANFARQDRLRQTGVIAKEDFDTALSNKNQAVAKVLAAEASVESAQLNLTFTQVISPIRRSDRP